MILSKRNIAELEKAPTALLRFTVENLERSGKENCQTACICRRILHDSLVSQRDAMREALELIAAHTSNCIEQCRAENNASLLRVHATVVSVQIMARKALAIADGAE